MGIISIENLEKLASQGNGEAQYELGLRYYRGIGVDVDYEKAKNYLESAVNNGANGASYYLGVMYYNGKGTPTDHLKAKEYFEKAEASNNVFSSYYLGKLYYWGDGVEQNMEKANEYKAKVLAKPFFSNQDTDTKNFYSFTDFEGASRTYAINLQKKVQNEFSSLFGNENKLV
ncbi:MAG: sel1 repeat family protein [Clostridia bacterium]|nr:sel1 repeat family protein [Clostridia bacterium]